jgi:plasmid stabilization system protein ParE
VSWRVIVRPEAESDLTEAAHWYETQRPNLGGQFMDEMRRFITMLRDSPERYSVYYCAFRRLRTVRFPYKIFYRIEGNDVIVVRVLHAKRDHRLHLKP